MTMFLPPGKACDGAISPEKHTSRMARPIAWERPDGRGASQGHPCPIFLMRRSGFCGLLLSILCQQELPREGGLTR